MILLLNIMIRASKQLIQILINYITVTLESGEKNVKMLLDSDISEEVNSSFNNLTTIEESAILSELNTKESDNIHKLIITQKKILHLKLNVFVIWHWKILIICQNL